MTQEFNCSKYDGVQKRKCLEGSKTSYQQYKANRTN